MNLPKNKAVQKLAETFDIDLPEYYFEVQNYKEHDGVILIGEVKVFDSKGNFIRLADNKKLINTIHKYPVSFKKLK